MKKKPVCIALFSDRDEFECCSTMIASVLRRTDRDVEILCFCRRASIRNFESGRLKMRFLPLRSEVNLLRDSDWCALQVIADAPDWERCLVLGKSHLVFRDLGDLFDLDVGKYSIAGFSTGGFLGDEMGRARETPGVLQGLAAYPAIHPTILIDLKKIRSKGADAAWLEFLKVVKSGAGAGVGLGIRLHHIQPGKPTQNAYVERFNRSFRHEVRDAHVFESLTEVRDIVHEWMTSYNEERPHAALGNQPPSLFRQSQSQTNPEHRPELCF